MARIAKTEEPHHVLTIKGDQQDSECILVGGGKRAYLWAGTRGSSGVVTLSGPQTLRALAQAILREIPAGKRSAKRGGNHG